MRPFEYAHPETEAEAVELLTEHDGNTAVLAGGTDLIAAMKGDVLTPRRVVDLQKVPTLKGVHELPEGIAIGAMTTLEELFEHPLTQPYRSLLDVVDATHSIQVQSMGTLGGDLCHLPNCWYFRSGYGLLALKDGKSLVEEGENRYHAVLGNRGPAKYVSASRFAPALIAWGARVRIAGPRPDQEEVLPLESLYVTPKREKQGITVLRPGQFVSHVLLPRAERTLSASYEVLPGEGLDWPLAAASACVDLDAGLVRSARVVMGHVAPVPWVVRGAAKALVGHPVTDATAARVGELAVADATPLSKNGYKVQIARAAVKRALLRATGQLEGGL